MLVGLDSRDDAGVFLVSERMALVQTIDFFSPIVDDPYDYGQIAVANSLSDAYAMGATPLTALNVVGFPVKQLPLSTLDEILRGGLDKAKEAGVTILGGHSVKDLELKYGLAVTAVIEPEKIIRNNTANVGDQLILTKGIGTGILATALKAEKLSDEMLRVITNSMKELNKTAAEVMLRHKVTSCTDVTGFGLLGHLYETTLNREISARVEVDEVPLLPETLEWSRRGSLPGGLKGNRKYLKPYFSMQRELESHFLDILFDPQTSGGLLFTVPPDELDACLEDLHQSGLTAASRIGEIIEKSDTPIILA